MTNTGNKIITEEDMNPLSETYGQTRETIVFDPVTCPPGIDFKARYSTSQVSNKYVYCNGETTLITSEFNKYDYGPVTSLAVGLCVDYIGDELFYNAEYSDDTSLRSVALSSTVETIGESAFANCRSLSSVTFVSGLTLIKRHAFNMCTSLAGNIVLPNSVTTIRDNAFYGCSSVSSFTLGTGVTYLGANVFRNCTGLNSVTVLATTPPSFGGYYNFTDTNIYYDNEFKIKQILIFVNGDKHTKTDPYSYKNYIELNLETMNTKYETHDKIIDDIINNTPQIKEQLSKLKVGEYRKYNNLRFTRIS